MAKKGLIVVAIIGVVAVIFGWKHISAYLDGRTTTINKQEVRVPIDNSISLEQIAGKLKQEGVIKNIKPFINLAAYKGLTNKELESGMYAIPAGTSYRSLLNGLASGSMEVEVVVTFNNCKTIHDLAVRISKCLLIDSTDLENYIVSEPVLKKYDFSIETIPALFQPNSYRMYYDTGKEKFVDRMAEEFKKFWTPERMAKLKSVGLKTPSQAVTLASIVYGEQATRQEEWPIIAGLYLNRLNTGMKLQSDPTFKFCWEGQLEGVQRLTFEHRSKDCPYNTYLYAGLPPGPISMPPTGVVEAVLTPFKSDYLYMCAQPSYDGLHNFTHDYGVHAKNATVFQNWLAKELADK